MADYATTKIVKTLRFPGDTATQYQINAIKFDGHTWDDVEAINDRIDDISAFDALRYMGTIAGSTTSPGGLTVAANKGDVYKVTSKGYVMGAKVEIGDMLICNTDNTIAATSSNYATIATKWDIIQGNVDVEAILAHTHTGDVTLTTTSKSLSHTITPSDSILTADFKNGSATVTGNHGHTGSGSFNYTPGGGVGDTSIRPEGTVALTTPATATTGDATLTPSGTVNNSTEEFVTSVGVSEHSAHNHDAEFKGTAVAAHSHTVTLQSYTPEGSVATHKHNVGVTVDAPTATHSSVGSITTTCSDNGDDSILTIGTTASNVTYVKSVSASISETSVAPTFTGTAKAPTTSSVSSDGAHTPSGTITIENTTIASHTVTAPTKTHAHGFSGNNMYVHAAFTGTSASHSHTFTGTPVTDHPVDVTVNNFSGNFTGSATGTVTPSVNKVLTGVTIDNHSIDTVDSATVTTGNGIQA